MLSWIRPRTKMPISSICLHPNMVNISNSIPSDLQGQFPWQLMHPPLVKKERWQFPLLRVIGKYTEALLCKQMQK
ncbi:hypothetical protein FGO68_gene6896 [Halteria grandinella]|uniref:Uncharacterized protein n=1 Tax=Halteria grandinella TaxID=5974 RepID=A0A8J8T0U2_HALGN|nr:hypothetical protein FGO68_gene6896 [Halteria grandinella]